MKNTIVVRQARVAWGIPILYTVPNAHVAEQKSKPENANENRGRYKVGGEWRVNGR